MAAVFQIISGPMEGMVYQIEENLPLYIGRGSKNDIVLRFDPWISSAHAIIRLQDGKLELRDLNSSNGSYLEGQKITKSNFVPVKDYFVVGSTVVRICENPPTCKREPVGLKSEEGLALRRLPLVESAYRYVMERHGSTIDAIALLMAAMEEPGTDVQRFLRTLKVDLRRIAHLAEKLHVFEGDDRWLNDFLRYQRKDAHFNDCYLSPLAQLLLEPDTEGETVNPLALVRRLLGMEFNLAVALLGGKSINVDPANITEKITLSPNDGDFKGIILPARFWNQLREHFDAKTTLLLSGSSGTGKTSILKNCFHAMPLLDIPQLKTQDKKIFDCKVFLIFKEAHELPPYIHAIIQAIQETQLLAIDHFDFLLAQLAAFPREKEALLAAIAMRTEPMVLATHSEHLKTCKELLPKAQTLVLDDFLPKIIGDVIRAMVQEFELESKGKLSQDASRFIQDLFGKNTNFTALEAFLNYCVDTITGVSYVYKELMWAHRKKVVTRTFLENQWQNWNKIHQLRNL